MPDNADTARDIVAYCNGLSKSEFWSLGMGDVQNLLDEALEEIERLRDMNVELLGALRGLMNAWTSPKPDPTARPRAEKVLRQFDGTMGAGWTPASTPDASDQSPGTSRSSSPTTAPNGSDSVPNTSPSSATPERGTASSWSAQSDGSGGAGTMEP